MTRIINDYPRAPGDWRTNNRTVSSGWFPAVEAPAILVGDMGDVTSGHHEAVAAVRRIVARWEARGAMQLAAFGIAWPNLPRGTP